MVSPHTDDAEIGLGGTMAAFAAAGRRVWALDLTRGELGSNATPDERWAEAAAASAVLGLAGRVQLGLPDGFVDAADPEQVGAVGAVLRRLRPRWVATAPEPRRHPDHVATPDLVEKAVFQARLAAWQPGEPAHRSGRAAPPLPEPAPTLAGGGPFRHLSASAATRPCSWTSRPLGDQERALDCYASQFARGDGAPGDHDQRAGLPGGDRAPGAGLGPPGGRRTRRGPVTGRRRRW